MNLVLLHGALAAAEQFEPLRVELHGDFETHIIELPGDGETASSGAWSIEHFADHVLRELDRRAIPDASTDTPHPIEQVGVRLLATYNRTFLS